MTILRLIPLALIGAASVTLAQDASPATARPAAEGESRDIVVTGRSLAETAAALAACLARNCPPDEDIAATLAHAENQFIGGDYRESRGTMLSSIRRNRNESRTFPVELSDLYRANSRVAAHLGEGRAYQLSVLEMRDTLADGLPANDPRLLAARIEVADSRARLGYPDEARRAYTAIANDALRLGHPRIAAFARIRHAISDHPNSRATAVERNTQRARDARASLAEIATAGATYGVDMAMLADVLLARYERESGDTRRTTAIMARFVAESSGRRPLLISGDPVRLHDDDSAGEGGSSNVLAQMQTSNVDRRWIDVGFWVNADGRVDDVEVLRHDGDSNWATAVERSVKSRVYTPLQREAGGASPGFYMIERYTLTAEWRTDCTGSRMRCRGSRLQVERLDLTPEDLGTSDDAAASPAPATAS